MENINCNFCGNTSPEDLFTLTDLLLERKDVQSQFVQCQSCGLVYQNPRPTQEEMGQYYPPEYESYTDSTSDRELPWLLKKAYAYGISKRRRVVTRRKKGGRILDVGCATGTFLLGMKELPGWEVAGVEISPHAANIARKHQLEVFTGTLEEAHLPSSSFDAVTLWDVLEHLHDPMEGLREIHRILKPGGILVLRVPNGSSWDAKWFGPTWAGWDAPRHLYVFTIDTLKKMMEAAGFQISQMSCEIGSYPTFVLSVRFWLYDRNVDMKTRQRIAKWLYHPIARIISVPLFYLLGLRLKGPLLTMTATKKGD
jgi:SAM-dependent methyltransferase